MFFGGGGGEGVRAVRLVGGVCWGFGWRGDSCGHFEEEVRWGGARLLWCERGDLWREEWRSWEWRMF